MALQHLRSSTASKRPTPAAMSDGQLALNTNDASPGLFFKDSNGGLVKVGPVHVGTTAPNASPAAGGQTGNTKGEQWLDTSGTNPVLKIWDGSAWQSEAGEFVNASGDTMTGNLTAPAFIPNGSTVPTNGVYLPSANTVGISTNSVGRVFIDSSGRVGIGASSPSYFLHLNGSSNVESRAVTSGASSTAQWGAQNTTGATVVMGAGGSSYSPYGAIGVSNAYLYTGSDLAIATDGANVIKFATGAGVPERMRLDASGRLGIGTSSPNSVLQVNSGTNLGGILVGFNSGSSNFYDADLQVFRTGNGTERARIDSSGRVGIGTTSPGELLHCQRLGSLALRLTDTTTANTEGSVAFSNGTLILDSKYNNGNGVIRFGANSAVQEYGRFDTSGRLLVGTSTARSNFYNVGASAALQLEGLGGFGDSRRIAVVSSDASSTAGGGLVLAHQRSGTVGGNTIVQNGDSLGVVSYQGNDGTDFVEAAIISCQVDGTPGANNMPGRIVLSTTASGASSPTERMRITNSGNVLVAKTAVADPTVIGCELGAAGYGLFTRSSDSPLIVNRTTNDGTLVSLRQDNTEEGTISVSGTTVSYNGAHLSRWSQLPSGAERTEILRGTVLSNIDEMCEWGDEDNEQLNRMKVSDVEGDKNVSGVFQAWDDDDDTYTNDFYCAMTGDFIIRIAQGVTVERGDLLMSAGDGTAKPQDDDIIRSKTIAKVTSTNVSCTHPDGSYCVPCVLMAC